VCAAFGNPFDPPAADQFLRRVRRRERERSVSGGVRVDPRLVAASVQVEPTVAQRVMQRFSNVFRSRSLYGCKQLVLGKHIFQKPGAHILNRNTYRKQ
jgi:hypothetical protein